MQFLHVKRVDQPGRHGVLRLHGRGPFDEGGLVRHISPEFEARDQAAADFAFECLGDFVEVLADQRALQCSNTTST